MHGVDDNMEVGILVGWGVGKQGSREAGDQGSRRSGKQEIREAGIRHAKTSEVLKTSEVFFVYSWPYSWMADQRRDE